MVEDLAQIPNIVGVKDSSGQLSFILAVLEKVRAERANSNLKSRIEGQSTTFMMLRL
jgi:dihydrodipicolinate synthase/N-acetylneuraminate lyase